MSKSITDVDQLARIARSDIAPIHLIKLVQYSDKENLTEAATHYISKRALTYDYGNTGTDQFFKPWLEELGELRSSLTHMPGGVGSGITSKELDIVLENANYGGSRVATLLTAEVLEGATVEVAELLVAEQTAPPVDLTAYTGDEHTIIYRGVITRRVITTERIQLFCTTEFYKYEWPTILDPALAAPRDVGLRYPMPYGSGVEVLCPSHTVGWVTTLSSPIPDDSFTGNISVRDASGVSGSFTMRIGGESAMSASYVNATTINITARGGNASAHPQGSSVIEVVSSAIYVAAVEASAINKLSVRHPATSELIEVTTPYTVDLADTSITPNGSTVTFDDDELEQLAALLESQQPVVTHTDSGSTTDQIASGGTLPGATRDGSTATFGDLYNTTLKTATFTNIPGMTSQQLRVYVGYIPHLHTLEIYKGGTHTPANKIMTITAGTYNTWLYVTPAGYTGDTFGFHTHAIFADPVTIAEVQRYGYTAGGSAVQSTPSESLADSLSLNLELYADVDGPAVPYTGEQAYDFDTGTGWDALQCTHISDTSDQYEGTAAQVIDIDEGETTLEYGCETTTGWSVTGNLSAPATSGTKTEGTYSIVTNTTGSGSVEIEQSGFPGPVDLSNAGTGYLYVAIDVYTSGVALTGTIKFILGHDSSNIREYWFDAADFPIDTWVTVLVDVYDTADAQTGSFDRTIWDYLAVAWTAAGSGEYLYIDNLRTFRRQGRIQKDDIGGADLSVHGDNKSPIWFKTNVPEMIYQLRLSHSSTAYAGTSMGANYTLLTYQSVEFADSVGWQQIGETNTSEVGGGSPDPTDTETIQLWLDMIGSFVVPQPLDLEFKFDDLWHTTTTDAEWVDTPGTPIKHPCDVARHWISVIGDRTADETTFGTAETNLGDNELAVDMRGLGTNWIECLDGLSYISRANFIGEEAAAGVVWKMLTAESDYTWPVTGGTLDQFREENFVDAGRDENLDLFSGRTFLYGYKPSLGTGDEAFTKLIRIGADHNDSDVAAGVITAAVAAFGRVDAPVTLLLGIHDDATAKEISGYYYTEGARLAALFVVSDLSWSQGYTLECGDIRDLVRPWETGTIKVRVIEVAKDFGTQLVEVRLVEVT